MLNMTYEKAFAKVNFGLNVFSKRGDGFHNIESIFQTVDLFDELIVSEIAGNKCVVECESIKLPEKNTLTNSYEAFCQVANINVPGVKVVLKKMIPSGGGLGGGSADAAALVRALQKICGIKLSDNQLNQIAEKTGSDVFFFMNCDDEGKGCALVSGRGEVVKRIVPRTDLFLLLIFPKLSSSTKEAYDLVDEYLMREDKVRGPSISELEAIYRSDVKTWNLINTFTPALSKKIKEIDAALADLKKVGSEYVEMSGSGSTVFGVSTLEQQAINSYNLLAEFWNCKVVRVV
jgi:4-diphosphocytidyl-2-C-methyl-D-erythritol kinase